MQTNLSLAMDLAAAYAANLPHDDVRAELENRGCPRIAIDAAFADNLSASAVGKMDEARLNEAIEAAAREIAEAIDRHAAATSLGRRGGSSHSEAKRAASRANGAKGGRPTTEFHFGKVFRSEGGFRVCGGVYAGGPILSSSPWFATREEAERASAEMIARRAENERLDRLAGLRP